MPEPQKSIVIWWIRRDLRFHDNPALLAASQTGNAVLPLFILDPRLINSSYSGEKRLAFLLDGLRSLDDDLRQHGSRLVVREGHPGIVLAKLVSETGASGIYALADHSPYARQRDERIRAELPLHLLGSTAIHSPGAVLKADGTPYTVYSPFNRSWRALPLPREERLDLNQLFLPVDIHGESLPISPRLPQSVPYRAGEKEAITRLASFTEAASNGIFEYGDRRNRMDMDGTSQLSPYLRFGMLSPAATARSALRAIHSAQTGEALRGAETWLNEIVWRDFYIHILHHHPIVRTRNFKSIIVRWRNEPGEFARWKAGETGYPIVDAAMRQLVATGWMHNRARMITASFLTKDLLIDWRWGERWFMQHLIDGDPAANNGGWQWAAGTGTDAAPYFRVFNPVLQGKKFDPDGQYIRRWLPELANVPPEYIHEPWKMPLPLQLRAGCKLGRNYPLPVVDHPYARQRALDAYRT